LRIGLAREILDEQIKDEESMELIEQVAELANRCLDMASDQRPPMREVAVADELERFRNLSQYPWGQPGRRLPKRS
jgi:hypothetical protein